MWLENASCGHQAFQALGHIWAHAYPGNKECLITLQKVAKFYIVPPVFPRAIIPPCSANSTSLLHIFATCQLRELYALCQCALFVLLAQFGPWSALLPKSWTVMVEKGCCQINLGASLCQLLGGAFRIEGPHINLLKSLIKNCSSPGSA